MAKAAVPNNVLVQQGNNNVLVSWNIVPGAVSYSIQRDTNPTPAVGNPNYVAFSTANLSYLDTTTTSGTQYYYNVASVNLSGTSNYSNPQAIIPVVEGQMSLAQLRLAAQQRADRVNSNFVTTQEWNSYINQSLHELYDLLICCYEDYFVAAPYQVVTDGQTVQYPLPANFFKLMGVDCGLDNSGNAWVTLKKFDFISRNRYVYPNITSTFLGVFNLQYRLVGNTLMFIPTPSANQILRIWYIPRLNELLQDTDVADFYSGWSEYVIVDAAIKALQKEESDCSLLMEQKQALKIRIEESAMNRDAGQPDTVSDVRSWSERFGAYGTGGQGDSSSGGF